MGATYTRYSDDISFSSNGVLPDLSDIASVLSEFGFDIAERKTRRSKRGQAHYVTGLSISDPERPHIPRDKKRRLRQELHYARKFGLADHFHHIGINDQAVVQREVNRLDGMVKFAAYHEPRITTELREVWRSILQHAGMKASFVPRGQMKAPFVLLIDEAEFNTSDRKVLALCIVATQHVTKIIDGSNEVLQTALNDLWADGDVATLQKKGLHFADATEDIRLAYVKRLARMPFEGYVAYSRYDGPGDYEATYIRLLSAMIFRRLMASESQLAYLVFEENSKVSKAVIEGCVRDAFDHLKASNNRRPATLMFEFVGKPHLGISAPDFLLGVLGRYLRSEELVASNRESRARLMFERLRDKYRLILDAETGREFSRRRPIEPWV
jgi:hypothetical protein